MDSRLTKYSKCTTHKSGIPMFRTGSKRRLRTSLCGPDVISERLVNVLKLIYHVTSFF